MGLRTASVRHPLVMVMAPALTETSQSQNFKLPLSSPSSHLQPTTLVNSLDECNIYATCEEGTCHKGSELRNLQESNRDLKNAFDNLNTLAFASELLKGNDYFTNLDGTVESSLHSLNPVNIMNNSPLHMGDHNDKMGLQKAGLDAVSSLLKDKNTTSDVDQLFNNLSAILPTTDIGAGGDIGQNVDEIMQVIKSIEASGDRLSSGPSDLGGEAESMFPLSTDLTTNLSSFEKELLNDVDMMSMSMEDQLIDESTSPKESQAKENLADLQRRQVKLERKLDFLLRRLRKVQARCMGQHISGEIAGVFEHVHRTLRRTKDGTVSVQSQSEAVKQLEPSTSVDPVPCMLGENISVEKLKPISQSSAKNLVRKFEMTSILQANTASRQRHSARYFGSGSVEPTVRNNSGSTTTFPQWSPEHKLDLLKVSGMLQAKLRLVQEQVDSEATVSSSGGESCDEFQSYNNPHQQYLSIQKRAAWRYAVERASIAARWTWLQAQISDLEYRIRQHSDLHRQIRSGKGSVTLDGASPPHSVPTSPSAVNGYRGQLPGASLFSMKALDSAANGTVPSADLQCSRTRPLINFRKRKLLQIRGLHAVSKKAARPATIRCGCVPPTVPCALCTGRTDPTHPRDLSEYLSKSERISLLDPAFHPVFSLPEDVSASIHFEAIMKTPEWQQKSTRSNIKSIKFSTKVDRADKSNVPLDQQPKKSDNRRKYTRLFKSGIFNNNMKSKFRGRKQGLHSSSLARIKKKRHTMKMAMAQLQALAAEGVDEEVEAVAAAGGTAKSDLSPSSSPLLSTQAISGFNKRSSRMTPFDIDNIVIPYSVAACTRVEKLQYKEILTPKWRLVDPEFATKCSIKNNGLVREPSQENDVEDLTEEAVVSRHDKCEHDEKKKFLSYLKFPLGYGRSRSHKRTDSRAESSGGNTPDPMSPAPQPVDHIDATSCPITSPPATPLSMNTDDSTPLPSINLLRRRTISQSRGKDKDEIQCVFSPESIEFVPYDCRVFPLNEETFDKMLKHMPEHHQFNTNIRAQDPRDFDSPISYLDEKADTPDSESTESALGDEDPNDPEWVDMERLKDRYKR